MPPPNTPRPTERPLDIPEAPMDCKIAHKLPAAKFPPKEIIKAAAGEPANIPPIPKPVAVIVRVVNKGESIEPATNPRWLKPGPSKNCF